MIFVQLPKICFLFIKQREPIIPRKVTGGNTPNAKLKTMPELSLKILQNRKTLEFPDLKRGYEIYTKRKIINLRSNP